jgi:dihydrofolate reductase
MYLIAAMTKNGVIGKGNELPWNIPDELKNFRRLTLDSTVIMGYRTFQSIGRPLPKRNNIILSPEALDIPGVDVCTSLDQAVSIAQAYGKKIFVIGGAYTYAQFLPIVDRLYISYIKQDYDGDVFFTTVDWSAWEPVQHIDYPEFEFVEYRRK